MSSCCTEKYQWSNGTKSKGKLLRSGLSRALSIGVQVGLPSLAIVAVPKCPACVAAYVAVGTGVYISLAEATNLRTLILILSGALLIYFAMRNIGYFKSRKHRDSVVARAMKDPSIQGMRASKKMPFDFEPKIVKENLPEQIPGEKCYLGGKSRVRS